MENNNAISWILVHYLNLKKILYICAKLLFLSELFARMIWTNFLCPKLCRYKLFSFCNSGSSALQCGDECWCMLFLKELFCPTQERNCPAGPVDLGIARPGEKCRVRRSRRPWRGGGEEGWGGGMQFPSGQQVSECTHPIHERHEVIIPCPSYLW